MTAPVLAAPAADAQWILQAREAVLASRAKIGTLRIEGHGSKHFYGQLPAGDGVLHTAGYAGIVNHDPTELVVVARAGTPIESLEATLAQAQQRLAFEPPRFGGALAGRGTVGGMVATGLSGPGRFSAGPCRDFILGMTVMDAEGQLLRYGGTVMKNVAGYDVSRLHTGAMGILGLILDVAIKVLPEPAATATVALSLDETAALERVNAWSAEPPATLSHCLDTARRLMLVAPILGGCGGGDGCGGTVWSRTAGSAGRCPVGVAARSD